MKEHFQKKVLPNGLTILFEKRSLPVVSVGYAVRCGGANESSEEKGISHFIEHLLFKGTPSRNAKRIAEDIEKNGGVLNGFTDETITAYFCKMPSAHVITALEVLTDMLLHPLFDPGEIEKERKVIFEEIKMRKDDPRSYVFDKMQEGLYESPLGEDLIGTHETLKRLTREQLLKRFGEVYAPNNLILCVVGDADFDAIVSFVEKQFAKREGIVPQFPIATRTRERVEKRAGIDQVNMVVSYHLPLVNHKDAAAARVLSAILGDGMSSRLFSEIREKRNLAYHIHAYTKMEKDFSYGFVYVGTTSEKMEEVRRLILEEFGKVATTLEEKELREVKEQLIGNHEISMEDSTVQMSNLFYSEIRDKAERFYNFEKEIKQVNLADVKRLAQEVMQHPSFFALVPS